MIWSTDFDNGVFQVEINNDLPDTRILRYEPDPGNILLSRYEQFLSMNSKNTYRLIFGFMEDKSKAFETCQALALKEVYKHIEVVARKVIS